MYTDISIQELKLLIRTHHLGNARHQRGSSRTQSLLVNESVKFPVSSHCYIVRVVKEVVSHVVELKAVE